MNKMKIFVGLSIAVGLVGFTAWTMIYAVSILLGGR